MNALTNDEVRRLLLYAQQLGDQPPKAATKQDVTVAIRHIRALQIDTINVVARSQYLVLFSRLGSYEAEWLDELLAEGELFEYWSHAVCFLPGEDYGLYRRQMLDRNSRKRWHAWLDGHRDLAGSVLARIRDEGPRRSVDFRPTNGRPPGGWWSWTDERMALEALFIAGELMVTRRENFQRVYDLRERLRPDWDDARTPAAEEMRMTLITGAAGALGVARPEWIAKYAFLGQPIRPIIARVVAMASAGQLEEVQVEGWKRPGYALPGWVEAHRDGAMRAHEGRTTLLSPFDPVVRDRERLAALFGFDYRIECYTPAPKRQYGYYTLPILHGDRMVGRLDPKAHRREGVMEIKSIHLEPGVEVTAALADGLRETLHAFAAWHRTPDVQIVESNPAALAKALGRG